MDKNQPNYEFGEALKQIWKAIAGLENKTVTKVKDELIYEMEAHGLRSKRSQDRASNTLDHWGKGHVPNREVVDFLAEVGIQRAKLGSEWLNRFLRAAGYSEALRRERIRALYTSGESALPFHPVDLPPRQTDFFGRADELEVILEALTSNWTVCLVEGMGGVGKTTLVREVAYACARQPRAAAIKFIWPQYNYIIWTTGEDGRLNLNDLLDTIAHRLGYLGFTPKELNDKRHVIQDILAQQSVLLIVDNFETITDPAVSNFLVGLPPGVKVVLTSREEEKLLAPIFRRYPPARIHLGGLSAEEALLFLRCEAKRLIALRYESERARLEAVLTADETTLLSLIKATGGNPKAIALALGHIADNATPLKTLVRDLYAAADSLMGLFDYFFRYAWEQCGEDACHLWRVIPFFSDSASGEALAAAAGLQGRYFHDALEQLRGRSLIEVEVNAREELRYRAHPMVRAFAAACLRNMPEFEALARERWVNWYLDFAKEYGDKDWEEWHVEYSRLEEEWPNFLAVFDWCAAHEHYEAIKAFWHEKERRVNGFANICGYWDDRLTWLAWLIKAAEQQEDWSAAVEFMVDKAWTITLMGQEAHLWEAEELIAQAWSLRHHVDPSSQCNVANNQAVLRIRRKDYAGAIYWLDQSEAAWKEVSRDEPKYSQLPIMIIYHRAQVYYRTGDYNQAKILYQQVLENGHTIRWERAVSYAQNWLADIAIAQGNLDEAASLLQAGLPVAEHSKERRRMAFYKHSFARLEQARGNLIEARRWALEALDGFERLAMQPETDEVHQLLELLDAAE